MTPLRNVANTALFRQRPAATTQLRVANPAPAHNEEPPSARSNCS